jgi:hypothetical protein
MSLWENAPQIFSCFHVKFLHVPGVPGFPQVSSVRGSPETAANTRRCHRPNAGTTEPPFAFAIRSLFDRDGIVSLHYGALMVSKQHSTLKTRVKPLGYTARSGGFCPFCVPGFLPANHRYPHLCAYPNDEYYFPSVPFSSIKISATQRVALPTTPGHFSS